LPARVDLSVIGSATIAWERVGVRAQSTFHARVLTTFAQFQSDYRRRTVLVVRALPGRDGKPLWYRVSIPGRPNGRSGWVPAASLEVAPADRWLVIMRGARRFAFVLNGRVARTGPVAVGAPDMPTPLGLYYVQRAFRPVGYPILGAFAFATSAYSALSDWPDGGIVGVHGTNTPALIGQAVSHGCVRLLNRDIEYLHTVVRVGTPVKIVA
jgi:lipoprotein-anchoring transpeptidase ErfK/SrfK